MTGDITKYCPSDWLDEVVPDPQEDVNQFLRSDGEGWYLIPVEEDDPDENEPWPLRLVDGQRVSFYANRHYGDFKLTIAADGSYSTDRPIPDDANCFRVGYDIESLSSSLAELIENSELAAGEHDIDAYFWSDIEYFFRFEIADGVGKLVELGAMQ